MLSSHKEVWKVEPLIVGNNQNIKMLGINEEIDISVCKRRFVCCLLLQGYWMGHYGQNIDFHCGSGFFPALWVW